MNQDFINLYIENLNKEIGELLKVKVILQTQIEIQQKLTADLQQKILQYEENANEKAKKVSTK